MAKLAVLETKARYVGSTSEGEQAHGGELFRFYDLAVDTKSGASLATFCSVFAAGPRVFRSSVWRGSNERREPSEACLSSLRRPGRTHHLIQSQIPAPKQELRSRVPDYIRFGQNRKIGPQIWPNPAPSREQVVFTADKH